MQTVSTIHNKEYTKFLNILYYLSFYTPGCRYIHSEMDKIEVMITKMKVRFNEFDKIKNVFADRANIQEITMDTEGKIEHAVVEEIKTS